MAMSDDTFNVVLLGATEDGQKREEIKLKLSALFKQDIKKVDALLAKPVVIRKNLDYETATKYKNAIEKTGALCEIKPEEITLEITLPPSIAGDNKDNSTIEGKSKKTFKDLKDSLTTLGNSAIEKTVEKIERFQKTTPETNSSPVEQTNDNQNQLDKSNISLWNPEAAANWSFLFTPILGSWLHAKNWLVLGNKPQADKSMYWFYASIAVLVLLSITGKPGAAVGYYFIWWYFSAKQQIKYVKEQLGDTYKKNGWVKILSIATLYMVIGGAFISVLSTQSASYSCDNLTAKKLLLQLIVDETKKFSLAFTRNNEEKLKIEQSLTNAKLELINIRTAEKHENIKKSKCSAELVSSDGKDLEPHFILASPMLGIALTNSKTLSIAYTVQLTESGQTYVEIPR